MLTLRDKNHKVLEGEFIYLRDFGGVIISEQSEDWRNHN